MSYQRLSNYWCPDLFFHLNRLEVLWPHFNWRPTGRESYGKQKRRLAAPGRKSSWLRKDRESTQRGEFHEWSFRCEESRGTDRSSCPSVAMAICRPRETLVSRNSAPSLATRASQLCETSAKVDVHRAPHVRRHRRRARAAEVHPKARPSISSPPLGGLLRTGAAEQCALSIPKPWAIAFR